MPPSDDLRAEPKWVQREAVMPLNPACAECGSWFPAPHLARLPTFSWFKVDCECGWTGSARFWTKQRDEQP